MSTPMRRILGTWLLLAASLCPGAAGAQLIEGIDSWADATVGLRTTKWRGPRVPYPVPTPRPVLASYVDSVHLPLRVHAPAQLSPARIASILAAAEHAFVLLRAAGFLTSFGDAGQGESGARDVYVVAAPSHGASAAVDASDSFHALDGARAYALLDVRVPSSHLLVCSAQALMEAELLELDPAEAESVRRSSAAYFAYLLTGQLGCDADDAQAAAHESPLLRDDSAEGVTWLARLGARQDRNRGTFLWDMWQFARQRTWEGRDLRASPDLLEAIAKALELARTPLALVAAELGELEAHAHPSSVRELAFGALPAFLTPTAIEPLGVALVRVRLERPQPGTRMRVWSKGEPAGRFTLAATRLGADGSVLSRLEIAPRKEPSSQLSIELDEQTTAVLISVTNVGADPAPDPDTLSPLDARNVTLTIDSKQ